MTSNWLEVGNLSKNFGGVKALSGFSCIIGAREIVGIIGPNGSGKTTFFNLVTGFIPADTGTVSFRNNDLLALPAWRIANKGIARTFQITRLVHRLSVLDNVLLSFRHQPGENLFRIFFKPRTSTMHERANRDAAISLLEQIGLSEKIREPADALSYGQQKLLNLTCCLASGSDLFLLDEPVAGVAPEMIEKIVSIIKGLPGKGRSVVLIEHNIDVVMQLCTRVIFMDAGTKICEGTPEAVRNDPRVLEACLGK